MKVQVVTHTLKDRFEELAKSRIDDIYPEAAVAAYAEAERQFLDDLRAVVGEDHWQAVYRHFITYEAEKNAFVRTNMITAYRMGMKDAGQLANAGALLDDE